MRTSYGAEANLMASAAVARVLGFQPCAAPAMWSPLSILETTTVDRKHAWPRRTEVST